MTVETEVEELLAAVTLLEQDRRKPPWEHAAVHKQQAEVRRACVPLLHKAFDPSKPLDVQTTAMAGLAKACRASSEVVMLLEKTGLLQQMWLQSLKAPEDPQQSKHLFIMLQLAQAIAEDLPEAASLQAALPLIVQVAAAAGPFKGCLLLSALKAQAAEVLRSLCHGARSRGLVARSISRQDMEAICQDTLTAAEEDRLFSVGVLLACIAELPVPFWAPGGGAESGVEESWGDMAANFWAASSFFVSLAGALAAAARNEEWPPDSGIFPEPWKLTNSCTRLAAAGLAAHLRYCAVSFVHIISTREDAGAHPTGFVLKPRTRGSRAARSAAVALRAVLDAVAAEVLEEVREVGSKCGLRGALAFAAPEEPAAVDLLEKIFPEDGRPLDFPGRRACAAAS